MQMYLELIRKMKKYNSSKEVKRIEKTLLEIDSHMKNYCFNESKTIILIDKIIREYKEDFNKLSIYLNYVDNGGTNSYHRLHNISYNLFRLAVIKALHEKSDVEIMELINNNDQILGYELEKIVS